MPTRSPVVKTWRTTIVTSVDQAETLVNIFVFMWPLTSAEASLAKEHSWIDPDFWERSLT